MKESNTSKDFFNIRIFIILLITFFSLIFYSTYTLSHTEKIGAQMAAQLGPWQSTPPFPDDGSPYGSFVRNGKYYVNTTHIENGIQEQKYTYLGTPGADGNITSWTKAWQWHGGTHGFGSVTVQWDNEQKVFMTRNGHIAEYVFNPDGTINGNDYKFWGNEKNLSETFDGRLWVWDSLVFAPLTTGRFVYHLGGFSCPGHGCKNTCTDAGCSGADVNYKNNGNIYYQQVPFVHWSAAEQFYKFKYTGKNHPDYSPTVDNIDAPGKSVFYAPNGGADYGYIYVTRNRSLHLYKVRVNSDGSLGDFTQEKDLLPALSNSQDGYDRGDIFVIGNTFFAARGRRIFSAAIDPTTGALGNWDDSVPDLPADQVEVMGWGRDNEGAMWGIIGNYVYLTGQHSVYYAKINGYTPVSPPVVTGNPNVTYPPTATPIPGSSMTPTPIPGSPTAAVPGGSTSTPAAGTPTTAAATPQPGTCSTLTSPTFVTKEGAGMYPGKVKIEWNTTPGTKTYSLRIDDMTNEWKGDCSVAQNPGDICVDNIAGSVTSYEFTATETHTYHYWIHSINYCGEWSNPTSHILTIPPVGDGTTCNIQGYRTMVGSEYANTTYGNFFYRAVPEYSFTTTIADSIVKMPVTATGGTVKESYQVYNPYFFKVAGDQTYTVSIAPLAGYTAASTYCNNAINCHNDLMVNGTLQNGNTRIVTCPAGGFADLWWYYIPASVPTLSLPRPTAASGGSPSPTVPVPTATIEYPTPTPSPCPAIGQLAWREGIAHYTRTVSSYTVTESVEVIALHLKQILQSGLVVEVSIDNGVTWMPSDSAQDDDHLVTVKNMHGKDVSIQVRLKNSCAEVSPLLSETVPPIPMPTISGQITQAPTTTEAPSYVPMVIVGGVVIVAIGVGLFLLGM